MTASWMKPASRRCPTGTVAWFPPLNQARRRRHDNTGSVNSIEPPRDVLSTLCNLNDQHSMVWPRFADSREPDSAGTSDSGGTTPASAPRLLLRALRIGGQRGAREGHTGGVSGAAGRRTAPPRRRQESWSYAHVALGSHRADRVRDRLTFSAILFEPP